MDMNNFFSFLCIVMVMKCEIMENWKMNFYCLIGIYVVFVLVMIFYMWIMSFGRFFQILFIIYCFNIMGIFVFIIGIVSIVYVVNIMENMIIKEKCIVFLMFLVIMIEKFVV